MYNKWIRACLVAMHHWRWSCSLLFGLLDSPITSPNGIWIVNVFL